MEPTKATLVDLLDRVLEKGLVVQADLIVSLAGVPLIGVNLRAALAGMETMIQYGLLRDGPPPAAASRRQARLLASDSWKPGWLLLSEEQVSWQPHEPSAPPLVIPRSRIVGWVEEADGVLDVVYREDGVRRVASFGGVCRGIPA